MTWDESCASYLGLRANAQLSDITVLLRRNIFETYRYQTDYAEDLDLGIRLIREGHKLGFLSNTRVLHSHNRPAYYFLKRGYVDVRFLADIVPNFAYPEIEDRDRLYADICLLYDRVAALTRDGPPQGFLRSHAGLAELLCAATLGAIGRAQDGLSAGDPQLGEFVLSLSQIAAHTSRARGITQNMLLPHISRHIENLGAWLRGIYFEVDEILGREIVSAIEKIFALHSGNHLAYLYLTQRQHRTRDEALTQMDRILASGV